MAKSGTTGAVMVVMRRRTAAAKRRKVPTWWNIPVFAILTVLVVDGTSQKYLFVCLFVCLLLRSESKRLQVKTSKSELGTWYNNEWTKNNNRNGGKRAMGRFYQTFQPCIAMSCECQELAIYSPC
jgi:hypothetical protein